MYAGPRLLAVADGMGGMAAGDVASRITIEAIVGLDTHIDDDQQMDALHKAFDAANSRIADTVASDPAMHGMGTTLTALLFSGTRVALAHVGDSRAYLLRDGELAQLTRDDTYVQLLVDQGVIRPEEASTHPRRAVVTQALQGEPVTPAYVTVEPRAGDRWLLCSDGLTAVVPAESIADTLRTVSDPRGCAERLLDLALRAGGPDNVTVIVADVSSVVSDANGRL
jgi:PPM family protein phosphatase